MSLLDRLLNAARGTYNGLSGVPDDVARAAQATAASLPAARPPLQYDPNAPTLSGMAQGFLSAARLPGEVARGETDPNSPEGFARVQDLASLAMTGGLGGAPAGGTILGAGPRRLTYQSPVMGGPMRISEQEAKNLIASRSAQIAEGGVPASFGADVDALNSLLPRFAENAPSRPNATPRKSAFQTVDEGEGYLVKAKTSGDDGQYKEYRLFGRTRSGNQTPVRSTAEMTRQPDGRWRTDMLETKEGFEGRGYASRLYGAVEKDTGQARAPSGQLMSDGYKFWQKRDPESVQFHQPIDGGAQYWSPLRLKQSLAGNSYDANPARKQMLQEAFDRVPPEGKTPEAFAKQFNSGGPTGAAVGGFLSGGNAEQKDASPMLMSQNRPPLGAYFQQLEQQNGLPSGYLARTRAVESGNGTNLANPNSSARGDFQFIKSTAKQFGLTDPMDPYASARAAADLAKQNQDGIIKATGQQPTGGELYAAHQQGLGGYLALRNGQGTGQAAMGLNGGAGMSPSGFLAKTIGRFDNAKVANLDGFVPQSPGANQGQGPTVANAAAQGLPTGSVAPAAPAPDNTYKGGLLGLAGIGDPSAPGMDKDVLGKLGDMASQPGGGTLGGLAKGLGGMVSAMGQSKQAPGGITLQANTQAHDADPNLMQYLDPRARRRAGFLGG